MKIEVAQPNDLAAIVDIYNQSILTKTATAELTPVTCLDKQGWFDEHQNNTARPIYVIRDEHQAVIAWGSFSDFFKREAYHITAEISIYIDKNHQGKGLGKEFSHWMLNQAHSLKIDNVVARVFAHNPASLAVFKNCGFEQWGYLPKVCDMNGFIADIVILGKTIND